MQHLTAESSARIAAGLVGLMSVDHGPVDEQSRVFRALSTNVLRFDPSGVDADDALTPSALASALPDPGDRRLFVQMAIVIELCRHPTSDEQLRAVESYGAALGVGRRELDAVRVQAHRSTEAATADFVRSFDDYIGELSEVEFVHPEARHGRTEDELWAELETLDRLPVGSLGCEFTEFYRRNGFHLPSPDSPAPAYYVSHDMNHVIAGYEPTGPGEIALGAFKLAMNPSEANWMASMVNLMIHEVGLIKHGASAQFVPFGGAPYPGPGGQFGAMSLPGAPELVAEAFVRGAACTSDFSRADHLSLVHLPLVEVREMYHVTPLQTPMNPGEDPGLWPTFT